MGTGMEQENKDTTGNANENMADATASTVPSDTTTIKDHGASGVTATTNPDPTGSCPTASSTGASTGAFTTTTTTAATSGGSPQEDQHQDQHQHPAHAVPHDLQPQNLEELPAPSPTHGEPLIATGLPVIPAPQPASQLASTASETAANPDDFKGPGPLAEALLPDPASSTPAAATDSATLPSSSQTTQGHEPLTSADSPRPASDHPATAAVPIPQTVPHFVAPSSYLRPQVTSRNAMAAMPEQVPSASQSQSQPEAQPRPPRPIPRVLDKDEIQGLRNIREFLKVRCGYDVFPLSFRLIVLDNNLLIKKSLDIMIQNTIVSAPLWDSKSSSFAGILTATDFINVIQYYCQFPDEMSKLDKSRLSGLRDIEKAIGAIPIETVSVNPQTPLFEAIQRMLSTRARRIPLVDVDDETGKEWVVSVITQYRILKFIAVNNEHNTVLLKHTVRELDLGTYSGLTTAHMDDSVLDVIHKMVERNISCVPIVDEENRLLNVFEAVDIIPCIKGGNYDELHGSIGDALCKRPEDSPGIYTCSEHDRLQAVFDTVRKSRVHRLIVVDDDNKLRGIISLSDILMYVLFSKLA